MINIQNEDHECFRWWLVWYLNPGHKSLTKIRNIDKEFAKQLNIKGVKLPIYKKAMVK